MSRPPSPQRAFLDPRGKNRAEVQQQAQQLLTALLDHLSQAAAQSPLPNSLPDLGDVLPAAPNDWHSTLARLQQFWQAAANPAHPAFLAHMDSTPTTWAWLGEMVTAALNNNMLSAELSPLFTRLEQRLLQDIATLFGLPATANGNLCSGGSLANLHALTAARQKYFGSTLWGLGRQPVLFASAAAHVSLQKAAAILGLGAEAVQPVPISSDGTMDCAALQTQIRAARQAGQLPFCVVATAGTTVTGSIDSIATIASTARTENLWLHVDAAYGGALIFSPTHRALLDGIAHADSITFNPQKWLYVPKTCAMVLFARASDWQHSLPSRLPYMQHAADAPNLGAFGLQGTRAAESLKLWLALQQLGQQGIATLIAQAYAHTAYLHGLLHQRPFIRIAHAPHTNIICWRAEPNWLPAAQWDTWNTQLNAYLRQTHRIALSLPQYQGELWQRVVLLNPHTDRATLQRLLAAIDSFALAG